MLKRALPWLAGVLVVAIGVGLWAFEPWRIWTSSTIDEPLPTSTAQHSPPSDGQPQSSPPDDEPEPELIELDSGEFEDAEHDTSGIARILELADGSRFLRLEDLDSSDGPDLHVWISDQPSGGSWGSYDDGRYLRLGDLKATNGNQNYEIPSDADLSGMTSVVIWCDRFNVAFGTAPVSL